MFIDERESETERQRERDGETETERQRKGGRERNIHRLTLVCAPTRDGTRNLGVSG